MKRSIVFLLCCFVGNLLVAQCKHCDSSPLFIKIGESNSGSTALNSSATSIELSPNPNLQIINNNTLLLETFQVGVNNNLDHAGQNPALMRHGMDLQISEYIRAGNPFPSAYMITAGQGGSKFEDWDEGDIYWEKFQERMAAFRSLTPKNCPFNETIVFISIGINDGSTTPELYQARMTNFVNRIRVEIGGNVTFYSPEFPSVFVQQNIGLNNYATTDPRFFVVDSDDNLMIDAAHWNYAGFKFIVDNAFNLIFNDPLVTQ